MRLGENPRHQATSTDALGKPKRLNEARPLYSIAPFTTIR
jgi:hypothetical protein